MDKQSTAGISLKIGSEEIEFKDQVKLPEGLINNKVSYNEYIWNCLKKASTKMYSIKCLGNFISQKKIIICYS